MNRIEFTVENYQPDWGVWHGVVPVVDGVPLVDLVADYEAAHGFHMPGSYAGLELPSGNSERWVRYLTGEINPDDGASCNGITLLLGCNCSVAGCWPLLACVTV